MPEVREGGLSRAAAHGARDYPRDMVEEVVHQWSVEDGRGVLDPTETPGGYDFRAVRVVPRP